jgi:hypothetical protein
MERSAYKQAAAFTSIQAVTE